MKQKLLFLFITLLTIKVTYSQCYVEHLTTNLASAVAPVNLSQSFTAECDGTLDSFQVYATETGTVTSSTLNIYDGNTNSGTPIYSQVFPDIIIDNIGDPIIFNISGNVPLTLNNQYTFQVTTSLNIFYTPGNPYSGGFTWVGSSWSPSLDLSFSINIGNSNLSTTDFNFNKIKIYPNPTSEFIQISGLTKTENYTVYNVVGTKISKGTISVDEKIDIQNLTNGIYFFKLEKVNFKFIKE